MELLIAVTGKGGYNGGACRLYLNDILDNRGMIANFKEGPYIRGLVREFEEELRAGEKFTIGLRDRDIEVQAYDWINRKMESLT